MTEIFLEPKLYERPPSVCPKTDCGGTYFIPHEDGWQCFNCMKIIYKGNKSVTDPSLLIRYKHEKN
jgi:ribosomal protein S27AE